MQFYTFFKFKPTSLLHLTAIYIQFHNFEKMKGLIFVVLLSVTILVASASEAPQAKCGGGCVSSGQCANWAGNYDCRCSWFTCGLVFADQPEMRDVEQFEAFIKEYSGNPKMLASAAKAFRNKV